METCGSSQDLAVRSCCEPLEPKSAAVITVSADAASSGNRIFSRKDLNAGESAGSIVVRVTAPLFSYNRQLNNAIVLVKLTTDN